MRVYRISELQINVIIPRSPHWFMLSLGTEPAVCERFRRLRLDGRSKASGLGKQGNLGKLLLLNVPKVLVDRNTFMGDESERVGK